MPPVGFEPTISAGEGPKTYALDRAATGTGQFISKLRFQNLKSQNAVVNNTEICCYAILF